VALVQPAAEMQSLRKKVFENLSFEVWATRVFSNEETPEVSTLFEKGNPAAR